MKRLRSLLQRSARLLLTTMVAATLLVAAGPVAAEPAPDPQKQFTEALERFDRGDFAGALALFQRALGTSGSPNARLYVARCLRELGRLTEAYDAMYATTRDATARAEQDPRYAETRNSAAAELALLEPKIAKLIIVWAGAKGTEITLNGNAVAPARLGSPITVTPGEHVLIATPPEGTPIEEKIHIAGGASMSVTLRPPQPSGPADDGVDSGEAAEPDDESSGGGVRIAGVVVTGLGVAGMVLFGVAGASAQGEFSTLEDECGTVRCTDPAYADVVDSGKTWELVANVSLGVGLGAVVGGLAMIIFGGADEPEPADAPATTTGRRAPQPTWALDIGPVPGAGSTIGVRSTF